MFVFHPTSRYLLLPFLVAAGLCFWQMSAFAEGGVLFLQEKLEKLPESAGGDDIKGLEVTAGRVGDSQALRISGRTVEFPVESIESPFFLEFWVRPADWRADGQNEVDLVRFQTKDALFVLRKAAGRAFLELVKTRRDSADRTEQILSEFPVSTWIPRKQYGNAEEWNYVTVGVDAEGRLRFGVNGFLGGETAPGVFEGPLQSVSLGDDNNSSDFAMLNGLSASLPVGDELRKRYRSIFASKPLIPNLTLTVPKVDKPPGGDGQVSEKTWADAARMIGFVTNHQREARHKAFFGNRYEGGWDGPPGRLKPEAITGYLAHDGKALYLGLRTPHPGRPLHTQNHNGAWDRPLSGEESYEIFLMAPWTGEPEYVQLIGNPHGDQADLRVMNSAWNGGWDWNTTQQDGVWTAELTAPFRTLDFPEPAAGEIWGMNLFNTGGDIAWSTSKAYHNISALADIRFGDEGDPIIRPDHYRFENGRALAPLTVKSGSRPVRLDVEFSVFRDGEVFPEFTEQKKVDLAADKEETLILSLPVEDVKSGIILLTVREGETLLYAHHAGFPVAPKVVHDVSSQEPTAEEQADAGGTLSAEEAAAYTKTWTAEEMGEELLKQKEWWKNDLGRGDDVPAPWVPMEVKGQTVHCWGREYIYQDSILPVQIVTGGEKLLAAAPRFVMNSGGEKIVFERARVTMQRVSDAEILVHSVSEAGPWTLTLETRYEFDGFGKVNLQLKSKEETARVDSFLLEIPMQADRSKLFHYAASWTGHPPGTDAGAVPDEGLTLDKLREILWLGDHYRGLAWISENLKNWQIQNENGIQKIHAKADGERILEIKLADRSFSLKNPWDLVFAIQATPSRPRPENWRFLSDSRSVAWSWVWGDGGSYYPFHDNPGPAREHVEKNRALGREVMPASSQRFYSKFRRQKTSLGEIENPGLMHREVMLWAPLWRRADRVLPGEMVVPEKHTASGNWWGKPDQPRGLEGFSAASPFQDYYLWRLDKTIRETGLGALYLDQPMGRDGNPYGTSWYIDYRGEFASGSPIFASREMQKRIYRLFHKTHGKTHIKWHSSNQIMIPVISFTDIFWDGENYGHGTLKVSEFYSDVLSKDRMQAQHTGLPFGFGASLLPTGHLKTAPPVTLRDTLGYFLVHDSHVWSSHLANGRLIAEITGKWLEFPFEGSQQYYYWESYPEIKVSPSDVLWILHVNQENAMLILFNSTHEPVTCRVELDRGLLGVDLKDALFSDAETGEEFVLHEDILSCSLAPKDFRILRLKSKP